ncbi:hypothetical protein ACWDTP_38600 [Mycobacterium sp. NPDC003449]
MTDLYAQALADVRALRIDEPTTPAAAPAQPSCCTGDRRGYQWHQRNGSPACEASRAANAEYTRSYVRERRARRRAGEGL